MGLVSAGIRGIVKARGRVKPAKDILRQAPTQQELPIIKKDISSSVPTKLDDELSNLSKTQEADESLNDLDNIINKNEGSLSHQKAKEWRSLNKVPEEENIDPVTGKKQKKRRKFQEEAKLLTDEKGEIIPERLPKFRDEGAFKKYNPNDPEDKAVRIFNKADLDNPKTFLPSWSDVVYSIASIKGKKFRGKDQLLGFKDAPTKYFHRIKDKFESFDNAIVESRLDIPSYEKFDKWIASIILADKTAGAGTFYGRTVRLKNVRFAGHSKKSHDIAAAKLTSKGQRQYDEAIKKGTDEKVAYEAAEKTSKSPFAVMRGTYKRVDDTTNYKKALEKIESDDWIQVGFNPERAGYFYNKANGEPILEAEEVIQIGALVLAKPKKLTKAMKKEIDELKKTFRKGGIMALDDQMNMFEEDDDMGLMQEGGDIDPVSGNEVPLGGTQEGVRDDVEANVSEGEMVIPEDVVRYHGVEHFMKLRDEAKMGYKKMDAMGQMGNPDEASIPDDAMFNPGGMPFSVIDMEYVDEEEGVGQEAARYGGMPAYHGGGYNPNSSYQDNQYGFPHTQTQMPSYQTGGFVANQGVVPSTTFLANQPTSTVNINPATGQPIITPPASPTVVPATLPQVSAATSTPSTLTLGSPVATPTISGATAAPTNQAPLPRIGTVTGGAQSFKFFRNEAGQTIQIPVINGRQVFEAPAGFTEFNPDDPFATLAVPDDDDDTATEDTTTPRPLSDAEKARAGLPPFDAGPQEGPEDIDTGPPDTDSAFLRGLLGIFGVEDSTPTENPEPPELGEFGPLGFEFGFEGSAGDTSGGFGSPDLGGGGIGGEQGTVGGQAEGQVSGDQGAVGAIGGQGLDVGLDAPTGSGISGVASSSISDETEGGTPGPGEGAGADAGGEGDDGGPSASYICTATYNAGLITTPHFKSLKKYGIDLRRNDPYLMKAYDMFGPILAQYVYKNKNAKYIAKFLTKYYKDSFNNKPLSVKQKIFKIISNYILRPTYRTIGWISVKL